MIVEIKKTESGCTYKFDDSAYLGKSEKEHEKVIDDVSTIINEHLRSRKEKDHIWIIRWTKTQELGCCSGTWEEADEYARKKNKGDYIILE